MSGRLYGVGVGPGDPELLTLKAKRILEQSRVLAFPVKARGGQSTAFGIIKELIDIDGKELLELVFPMTGDGSVWRDSAAAAGEEILKRLREGKQTALITLGDVTLYSTCMYVQEYVRGKGFETELIPGILAYSAGAARAGISLAEEQETMAVVPLGRDPGRCRPVLEQFDNVVLMKAAGSIPWLAAYMQEQGISPECATVLSNIGLPEEYVGPPDPARSYGYFTTVIWKRKAVGKE